MPTHSATVEKGTLANQLLKECFSIFAVDKIAEVKA